MRAFGYIEGSLDAVVYALLEVLGPIGTVVVPALVFVREIAEDPVIDS